MRSMTGYGDAAEANDRYSVEVHLRSVNHRYLEIRAHLPDFARHSEPALREFLGGELFRGRIDASVEIRSFHNPSPKVRVDSEVARACSETAARLEESGWLSGGVRFGDLLRLPGAVEVETAQAVWLPKDQAQLLEVAGAALGRLVEARSLEGDKLQAVLRERVDGLRQLVERLATRRAEVRDGLAARLEERLAEILVDVSVDEDRMLQEVAVLADRGDIAEELDRLASHLDHFEEAMAGEGSIGKRLDFLAQEIFRELNTVGSKARNADLTRGVLDGKVLCEQLREQVQNVE
ncbi:MAG: YicC/YloC family endoribonuclease [Acidobacteriota bacterium]